MKESVVAHLCPILCDPLTVVPRLFCTWNTPGKNTGVGSHSLLQRIFLIQGSNLVLLNCRQMFSHLIHQGFYIMKKSLRLCNQILAPFLYGFKSPPTHLGLDSLLYKMRQVGEGISKVPADFKFWNFVPDSAHHQPSLPLKAVPFMKLSSGNLSSTGPDWS